ncbi:D-alanyl-D-alanine carboxypeptidase family protein [Gracilibacillus caseinilyticus]|uniref:D-alanyl-D-alanine carboxypeptidase family protein n=1 Tax=Gracilibacillus caseinilyticus TaxID=2932256 RepID=UPI002739EC66|nr:D-alanyl-D-alanine carboxypeptidase family protein [Gracilibacillus caseinilyticus]
MRKIGYCIIVLISIFQFIPAHVMATTDIQVSAQSAILMDQETGRVLFEKNADVPSLIASITKIMTAIIAIESGKMDEKVNVTDNAIKTEGSSIYLKKEDEISLEDLVYGLMLRSGNDAAVAISEYVGGSEEGFAYLMNEKAKWIGMTNSHFDNPHGLDSDTHYSTAYDMALLTKYAMDNEEYQKISGTTSYKSSSRDYPWKNKNKLLTQMYKYSSGGKTGYTKAAGRTLVSTAEKNGQTLIMVTLDAPNDWQDHMRLFEWGFETYPLQNIQDESTFELQLDQDQRITASIDETIDYPLTKAEAKAVDYKNYLSDTVGAFDRIGKRVFYLNDEPITTTSIYLGEPPSKKNSNLWTSIWQQFQHFLGDQRD